MSETSKAGSSSGAAGRKRSAGGSTTKPKTTTKPGAGPEKGRAFAFVRTDRGTLVPIQTLAKAEIRKRAGTENRASSKQLKADRMYMTDKDLMPLPFAVNGLLFLLDNCSYFDECVRQIARDVVGQGWDVTLDDEEGQEDEEAKAEIKGLMDDPNDEDETIADIFERAIIDLEAIGWYAIEVGRRGDGKVGLLAHVPAHTIRVHRDEKKYCQIRGIQKRWFKKFGYEKDVDAETGEESELGSLTEDKRANEMIFHRSYYLQSDYYGAPPILPAVGAAKATIGIRDYNLSFFENYGVPAAIVTVEGNWDEDAAMIIADFIDAEIKGSNSAFKTLVLNPPMGGKVTWEPLVAEVKEGHFKLYSKSLRDEILSVYKMPPYRVGIAEVGSLGGGTAEEATKIYAASTVNPIKLQTAKTITKKIIRQGLAEGPPTEDAKKQDKPAASNAAGIHKYGFWWGELDVRDLQAITSRCKELFGIGCMNRNEVRAALGDSSLAEEEDGNRYYINSSYVPISDAGANAAAMGKAAKLDELAARIDRALAERKTDALHSVLAQAGADDSGS